MSRTLTRPPPPSLRRPSLRTVLIRWLPWLPIGLAVGFTTWIVSRFSRVIASVHLNPDAGFAPILVGDLRTGTKGGLVLVGEASHLTAIGFLYVTRSFPFRDVIWDWGPYITFLIGLGIGAWACWRVAGPWAAAMVFAAGACAESSVLLPVMAEGIRGHTFFAVAVMAAWLVAMVQRPAMPTPKKAAGAGLAVAVAGATVASDPLFLAVALAPLVGAVMVVFLLRRDRRAGGLALLTLGVAGGALLLSQLIWAVMRTAGFKRNYLQKGYSVVDLGSVVPNVRVFWRHVLTFTHASPLRGPGRGTPAQLAMTLVVAGIILYAATLLFRLRRPPATPAEEPETALLAYTAFWVLSGLGVLAAFALSSFSSGPSDTSRYVIPVFLALAAVGPLWGRRLDWRRPVAAGCVALFCLATISARQNLFVYELLPGTGSVHQDGAALISYLRSEGLRYGYAGYFTSHPLTMLSDLQVYAFPVIACHRPQSDAICPFFVNARTAWYVPRPGIRSFLIQDTAVPSDIVTPPPSAAMGRPAATRRFGTMIVYVFDYDVASRFSSPCIDPGGFTCPTPG